MRGPCPGIRITQTSKCQVTLEAAYSLCNRSAKWWALRWLCFVALHRLPVWSWPWTKRGPWTYAPLSCRPAIEHVYVQSGGRQHIITVTLRVQVPMAPALGLLLHECCYQSYNDRWAPGGEEMRPRLSLADWDPLVKDFKVGLRDCAFVEDCFITHCQLVHLTVVNAALIHRYGPPPEVYPWSCNQCVATIQQCQGCANLRYSVIAGCA
jgi:hypothetical protein